MGQSDLRFFVGLPQYTHDQRCHQVKNTRFTMEQDLQQSQSKCSQYHDKTMPSTSTGGSFTLSIRGQKTYTRKAIQTTTHFRRYSQSLTCFLWLRRCIGMLEESYVWMSVWFCSWVDWSALYNTWCWNQSNTDSRFLHSVVPGASNSLPLKCTLAKTVHLKDRPMRAFTSDNPNKQE
jgi:hypothetical protein